MNRALKFHPDVDAVVLLGAVLGALCIGCRTQAPPCARASPHEPSVTFVRIRHVSWWCADDWQLLVWGDPSCAAGWDDAASNLAVSISLQQASLPNGDFNNDGATDSYFLNFETAAMVVWDGCSLSANGFDPVATAIDDRDGDGLPELRVRRAGKLATLYSASGAVKFERR